MSLFAFLRIEWPSVFDATDRAANAVYPDPRTACFYARRALEILVGWLYKHDATLQLPYQDNLSALIHEPTFKATVGDAVFNKAKIITRLGNTAVHSTKPINQFDAQTAVKELFHIGYWLAHTYAKGTKPAPNLNFDPNQLPKTSPVPKQTLDQLQQLETQLRDRDDKLSDILKDKEALDTELTRLREEIAAIKKANAATPDEHNYSEAETRDYFIDLLLKEAGWPLDKASDREYEVDGMPNAKGIGYVDYVLWGDDGLPLAVVEAKKTRKDARIGQQQAKLYADCLEKRFGRRPVIFFTNGYEHWLWDDVNYPPRAVQGFYKKDELELLIQRRTTREPLATATINTKIIDRYYQARAVRRVCESFEKDKQRKALLVMATGSGKTRTVIALADLLQRCKWVKRVLFLADRNPLVNQAVKNFKLLLPDSTTVNLVLDKETEGRVYVSTYQTMIRMIDETSDGVRRFGVGHFDLLVIDEAHRSVFQKYKAIFSYFDSLLVGLTATPRGEINKNTYDLFGLETNVPTDNYSLEEGVRDKVLVPFQPISVPLRFQREGITYDELSEEEQEQWDELDWEEEGEARRHVEAAAVNKWLFNEDTVDKVLKHLMARGIKVAGGDRLGKTIIFAKNQDHANYIAERFDILFPHLKGHFARVITFETSYAQTLIEEFEKKDKPPHIAISVDMLDTGIDVPEVVNLVFFKIVRSRTKFWQMVGRGTRTCEHLFAPDKHKQEFYLFDYCSNLQFFRVSQPAIDGALPESLTKRLFKARLELVSVLDSKATDTATAATALDTAEVELRAETVERLRSEVAAMNLENFEVRPQRLLVETYAKPEPWQQLTREAHQALAHDVAGLPTDLKPEGQEAKQFDYLMLRLQLALLLNEPAFVRLRDQVKGIAGLLEEKETIPKVKAQMELIQDLQTEEWWQDVTAPMLDNARKRLRDLVKFIEKASRKPLYTNFEDELGEEEEIAFEDFTNLDDFETFRIKATSFLRGHEDHPALVKLRKNFPLSKADLEVLEQLLTANGIGSVETIEQAKKEADGLGLFIRSLVGMDREAAKQALDSFVTGKTLTANQIEFINHIVNRLTERGVLDESTLYDSPFIDVAPRGPDGLFSPAQLAELRAALHKLKANANAI